MDNSSEGSMQQLDATVASTLGTTMPALAELEATVIADYDPDAWGLHRLAAVTEPTDRAVASDLLVSSLAGARTAVTDVAIAQRRVGQLVGPNGRTMPRPDNGVDERLAMFELDAAVTDCVRAIGSALDCMVAAAVLVTGAPLDVQRAEGSWFFKRPDHQKRPVSNSVQEDAWDSAATAATSEGDAPAAGWLAWVLETRNAVVHRGHLLRIWLNRPGRRPGLPQFVIRTNSDPASLMRVEPHMRRSPWLPDMHALSSSGQSAHDLWLPEPTQRTLQHLHNGIVRLVEHVASELSVTWTAGAENYAWPAEAWRLARRDDQWRVQLAARFVGFEPEYPTPPPSQMRLHPDSARRAELAQRVIAWKGDSAT